MAKPYAEGSTSIWMAGLGEYLCLAQHCAPWTKPLTGNKLGLTLPCCLVWETHLTNRAFVLAVNQQSTSDNTTSDATLPASTFTLAFASKPWFNLLFRAHESICTAPAALLPVGCRGLRLDEKAREGMQTFIISSAGAAWRNEKQYQYVQSHSYLHLSSNPSFHPWKGAKIHWEAVILEIYTFSTVDAKRGWCVMKKGDEGWHFSNGKKENLAETWVVTGRKYQPEHHIWGLPWVKHHSKAKNVW